MKNLLKTLKDSNFAKLTIDVVKNSAENNISKEIIEEFIYEEFEKCLMSQQQKNMPNLLIPKRVSLDVKDSLMILSKEKLIKYNYF